MENFISILFLPCYTKYKCIDENKKVTLNLTDLS